MTFLQNLSVYKRKKHGKLKGTMNYIYIIFEIKKFVVLRKKCLCRPPKHAKITTKEQEFFFDIGGLLVGQATILQFHSVNTQSLTENIYLWDKKSLSNIHLVNNIGI